MSQPLRPNRQRAQWAMWAIAVVLVLETVSLLSGLMQYRMIQCFSEGSFVSDEELSYNDLRQQIVAICYLVAFFVSAIFFIMWFRRAYFNLHQKLTGLTYTEGWAAGCWFVPIVNLFWPYTIMKEIHRESYGLLVQKTSDSYPTHFSIIRLWWTLSIVTWLATRVELSMSKDMDTIEGLLKGTAASIVISCIGIVHCIVTFVMIQKQSQLESRLEEFYLRDDDANADMVSPEAEVLI